ncbi:MAG: hypothetical protein IJY27_06770 [Clostridia bacterium]|nr:hypothetical protein [Clostridia bacterium]
MKNKDILDAMNDIDFDMVEDAERAKAEKSRRAVWRRWGAAAACLCLVCGMLAAIAVPMLREPSVGDGGKDSEGLLLQGELWVDTRERNGKKVTASNYEEGALVWPWYCRAVNDQYSHMKYNGAEYNSRNYTGETLSDEYVGKKLGRSTAMGYDMYENDKLHTLGCAVYEISGVDPERLVAVKYDGHDGYYVFLKRARGDYGTLGELIEALNLTETVALTRVYIGDESTQYALSTEDSAVLWEIFNSCSDALIWPEYSGVNYGTVVSFSVTSEALGGNGLSWRVNSAGFLITNIESYVYYFNVGKDAVSKIEQYVLDHKSETAQTKVFNIVGTVTEIGEDYIKIDDSVIMKDPADGMVFTVYANDIRVSRYIDSGFLKVGQTVMIEHGGISAAAPTEVHTATELYEAIITDSGQAWIPE